jgi:hypothetical protein
MHRRTAIAGMALAGVDLVTPLRARASSAVTASGPRWTEAERQLLIDGLNRTKELVVAQTNGLADAAWTFRESPERWSIAEITEHLGLQEDMYFRELYLLSQVPAMPELEPRVAGKDERIPGYASDPEPGVAAWYLQPMGRWNSREKAVGQFVRSREKLTEFVRTTPEDLRIHFTFRDYVRADRKESLWSIRDLHQLVLTTIAHTERHVNQMKKVTAHPKYPRVVTRVTSRRPRER